MECTFFGILEKDVVGICKLTIDEDGTGSHHHNLGDVG
jgi:hypothetical protein